MSGAGPLVIVRDTPIVRSARVMQCEGLFDVSPLSRSEREWSVNLDLTFDWNVGLIVGPSGAGKSTVARAFWPDLVDRSFTWDEDRSVLDAFPEGLSIKAITELLSSVGFSSPPSWLRPYRTLSNGEQFRVALARTLAEHPDLAVVDEFTSVVDRTVARIGAAAVAKTVRRREQQFVGVSCHYDIVDWLEPDWVYQPHLDRLERGSLWRRPDIVLDIVRVHHDAWRLFRAHHYLDTSLSPSAVCFVAFWNEVPVCFSSWMHLPHAHARNIKREHRTVTLPDYQGVGIGNTVSDTIASAWRGLGFRATSTTGNPAMIHRRNRSTVWRMSARPGRSSSTGDTKRTTGLKGTRAWNRYVSSFEYVGPPMARDRALLLMGD